MSKYIIDIPDGIEWGVVTCRTDDGFYTRDFDSLEELNSDYINEHFGDLQDTAYQKGFEDGKAVNDKGCEGCRYGGTPQGDSPCFNCSNYYQNNWTAKDNKIEVGDEVTHKSDDITWTAVVTQNDNGILTLMGSTGAIADDYREESFVKTGRHFDIKSILEAMRYD